MDHSAYENMALAGEWLCDVEMQVSPHSPGSIDSPWGARNIAYIGAGEFNGPHLKGKVLPGGGDWPQLSSDGNNNYRLNVRAAWETDDGARLYVEYYGFIAIPPELMNERADLAALDPADYYFRSAPRFETGDERYAWLNTTLCVGIGRITADGIGYRIFKID